MAADNGDRSHRRLQDMQYERNIGTCSKLPRERDQVKLSGVVLMKAHCRFSLLEGVFELAFLLTFVKGASP